MRELASKYFFKLTRFVTASRKKKRMYVIFIISWLILLALFSGLWNSSIQISPVEAVEMRLSTPSGLGLDTNDTNTITNTRQASMRNNNGLENISLAFFYEPSCDCAYFAMAELRKIEADYGDVQQNWYNLSANDNRKNSTLFINFTLAYNIPYKIRGRTPFVFIGDYYYNYYDVEYNNVLSIIETYSGVNVPLWPTWELTWSMHIAFFYDPAAEATQPALEVMEMLSASWNQNESHLIFNNYSLANLTNGLLLDAYFSEFELSSVTSYDDADDLYAGVFIGSDFLLNDDITYESLNNTVIRYSGRNTPLHDITPDLTGGDIHIIIFYDPTCPDCFQAVDILSDMKAKYPELNVHQFPTDDPDTEILKHTYFDYYNVPTENRGTLGIFIGDKYFVDVESLRSGIEDQIKRYENGVKLVELEPDKGVVKDTFNSFTIPLVMLAGLVDSINPCAIAILIFFIGYLTATGRTKKEVLVIGISYTMGIFITYLALGLGLYYLLLASSGEIVLFSKFLYPIMAIIVIAFGLYSVYDYFKARKGKKEEMKLKLPKPIKSLIGRVIKHQVQLKYFALFAIVTGVSVSILEFMCTGQVYLPTIVVVAASVPELQAQAVLYLVLYNLMFISPLVIIFLGVYNGMEAKQLQGFLERNRALIKLLTAIMFFVLGAFLIWYALEFVFI